MAALLTDIRFALRVLRREPLFTAVAAITLALGIGATTAVFTAVDGVLLRPLPYRDPNGLVMLLYGRPGRLIPWLSPPNVRDLVAGTPGLAGAAAIAPTTVNLTGTGDPERVDGARVSWTFFDVLGVRMIAGRGFTEADAVSDGDALVLGEGLWRRRFAAHNEIVGSTVVLDGRPRVVVGIAPRAVRLPSKAEFWTPLVFRPRDVAPAARGAQWVNVVGRLRHGASVESTSAALQTLAGQLAVEYPRTNGGAMATAVPLRERIVQDARTTLLILFGAVALVLLVACVNVANLLLARAQKRQREVAVRAALGASRQRIVLQFLVESVVLGLVGAAAGVGVAGALVRVLTTVAPRGIPRLDDIAVDGRVLAFTLLVSVGTSILFGLVPAWSTDSRRIGRALTGRGSIGSHAPAARRLLVVGELALAVVLLVGAGLLLRSDYLLHQVSPGFNPDGVLTFSLSLPESKYPRATDDGELVSALLSQLRAQPGVSAAAVALGLPFTSDRVSTSFRRANEPDAADNPSAGMRVVTPDYFRTLQIPLTAGRLLDDRDDERAPDVVLVNRKLAQRYFADRDPIGQRIRVGLRLSSEARADDKTIVGVVADVKYGGLDEDTPPEIFFPYAQQKVDAFTVAVRTSGDPIAFAPAARRIVAAIDPELPVAQLKPMRDLLAASVATRRFTMLLLVTFAAVALALAAIGVYGVLAYLASQRTQEIGLRLAIGATSDDVVRLFVREGMTLAIVGLASGLLGALAAGRALSSLIFGVGAADPLTFACAAGSLTAVALLASYLPARRASKVDPVEALRAD